MSEGTAEVIRAAGVVVVRPGPAGPEILVVHRPRRDDWSLPKGKLEADESVVRAAVRECVEETGIVPVLGPPLPRHTYPVLGQPKVVDYWVAAPDQDRGFAANDEIDAARWIPLDEATGLLTYSHDRLLAMIGAGLPRTSPLMILRHAQAMKRNDFRGHEDARRPLTDWGAHQAEGLVDTLAAFGIRRIHSSDTTRCERTVRPYAQGIHAPIAREPAVSEHGHDRRPKAAGRRVLELVQDPEPIVLCSHRPVLPAIMAALGRLPGCEPGDPILDPRLPPAGLVVLHRAYDASGRVSVLAAERHEE